MKNKKNYEIRINTTYKLSFFTDFYSFNNSKDLLNFLDMILKQYENKLNNITYDFNYKQIIINVFDFEKKQNHKNIIINLKKDNYSLFKKIYTKYEKVFKFIYIDNSLYGSKTIYY